MLHSCFQYCSFLTRLTNAHSSLKRTSNIYLNNPYRRMMKTENASIFLSLRKKKSFDVKLTKIILPHDWHVHFVKQTCRKVLSKLKVQLKKHTPKKKKRKKWNKRPPEEKCVFVCIFDHWALHAQTLFCLRAAANLLNMG